MEGAGWLNLVGERAINLNKLVRGVAGGVLMAVLLLSMGCAHEGGARSITPENNPAKLEEASSDASGAQQRGRRQREAAERVALKAYEVREAAFSDFGMSVKTNFEVQWGGKVEWMSVNAVADGSSAARGGLGLGDQILAIDGQLVAGMEREAMLTRFFQRRTGESSRLLVLGHRQAMPRFVTLVAKRPGS